MSKTQFIEKSQEFLGEQAGVMGEGLFRVFDEDGRYRARVTVAFIAVLL